MKRQIITFLLSILIFIMLIPNNIYSANKKLLGDINLDNRVDSIDQLLIMRHILASARGTHPEWILTGNKLKLADVTQNDKVDNSDMLQILRYIAAKSNPEKIGNKHKEWLIIDEIDLEPATQPETEQKPVPQPQTKPKKIEATSIVLNKSSISLDMSGTKTETLIVTITPSTATNKNVTYSSNNTKVATVDKSGKITAVGNGTATITAKTANGKTAKCRINVITTPKSITLNKTSASLNLNTAKTIQLKATIKPSTATNKNVTYISNKTSIATVNKSGKVTAKKDGKAKITVKTSNGKEASCIITVKTNVINVLFIGNSKTYINNVDQRLQKLANAAGKKVHAERIPSYGGRTLDTLSTYDTVKKSIKSKKWDYIVFQEQTARSIGNTAQIENGCKNIINYAKKYSNKNVIPIYNATWVLKSSDQATQNIANSNFKKIKKKYGGKVAYSGNAFIRCSKKYPNITLYTDNRHPTIAGQYISACCVYSAIFGESPVGIKASDVSKTNAKKLQQISAEAMGY